MITACGLNAGWKLKIHVDNTFNDSFLGLEKVTFCGCAGALEGCDRTPFFVKCTPFLPNDPLPSHRGIL